MSLFSNLSVFSPNRVFYGILLGSLAGICYALLIPIVLTSINDDGPFKPIEEEIMVVLGMDVSNYRLAAVYLGFCALLLVLRTLSQVMLTHVSMDLTKDMRMKLYEKVVKMPLDELERIGGSKIITSITVDVSRIIIGSRKVPEVIVNSVTVVGMLGFLLYLNLSVFLFCMGVMVFGIVTYQIPLIIGNRHVTKGRHQTDLLYRYFDGLIYGAKELKLHQGKCDEYIDDVKQLEDQLIRSEKTGFTLIRLAKNYGDLISFFAIGLIAFVYKNHHPIATAELIGVIMALLYIAAPLTVVIDSITDIITAKISLRKVTRLFDSIQAEASIAPIEAIEPFNHIRFDGATYQYHSKNGEPGFVVGPVNVTFNRGELTFLQGGNGSGKSTFSKLFTQHYRHHKGKLFVGDKLIDAASQRSYRQHISAIFTDYYLFDKLYRPVSSEQQQQIERLLGELKLAEKVRFENGQFSTLALSDGQRKRLALLVTLLEDKDVYLFDEWAADQDFEFKEIFYYQILPMLKAQQKIILVISHDEKYFDVADRILFMERGQLNTREDEERK